MESNTSGLTPELVEQWKQTMNGVRDKLGVIDELATRVKAVEDKFAIVDGKLQKIPLRAFPVGGKWAGFENDKESTEAKRLFLEWMRCVAGTKGGVKIYDDTPDEVKRALTEASESGGGYLVPEIFIPELIRIIGQVAVMRPLVRVIPMATDTSNLPSLVSGIQIYWTGTENNTITQSDPVFGPIALNAKTMAALTSCSMEVEEDATIGLADLIATLFGEAIATEEDRCILCGNSDPFKGVLFESGVAQVTMDTTTFASVGFDDVNKTSVAISARSANGAMWFLSRTMVGVLQRVRDLNHQYVFQSPAGDQPAKIWNYPFKEVDVMPALGDTATSKNFLCFGNPKNIMLGDRRRIVISRSDQVGFKNNEVFFKATERIAVTVAPVAAWARLRTGS